MSDEQKLFAEAKEKWGIDSQILMLAEEASELSVATLHLLRAVKDKNESYEHFAEEVGDVKLMIEEMEYYFPRLWRDAQISRNKKLKYLVELLERK